MRNSDKMKRYWFCIYLLLCLYTAGAQTVTWKHGQQTEFIGKELSFLEDAKGKLTVNEIAQPYYQKLFQPSKQKILHFGFTQSIYWLKLKLINQSDDTLLLSLQQAFIPFVELYYQDSTGKWNNIKSGYQIPFNKKPVNDHFQVFPLPLKNAVYYLRLEPYLHAIPIEISTKNYWALKSSREKFAYGIYAGFLLFAVLVSLISFLSLRKIYFLNYSILVLFYLLTSALVMEGYAVYFFTEIDLMFWYKIIPVVDMPAFLLFTISFFSLRKEDRRIYKVTFSLTLFYIAYLFFLNFLPLQLVLALNQIFALAVFVLGIYIGISQGKKGNVWGYYFAGAYCIWFLLILTEAVYIQTGFPPHIIPISYVSTAIWVETFFLALLLAKRFQKEKKSDHLRQFELKNKIDRMEESFQREILDAKLNIQEQTFKSISQEIHDNVGQILSLAKVQVNILEKKQTNDADLLFQLKENIGQALNDLRDIAKSLNNEYLVNSNLSLVIQNQMERINRLGIVFIKVMVEGEEKPIDSQKKIILFRLLQEAVQNIIKHANATLVDLILNYKPDLFEITLIDNGKGFDLAGVKNKKNGMGLENISARAALIGGHARITSKVGEGTTVNILMPY